MAAKNAPAEGIPFFTPAQNPPPGAAMNPYAAPTLFQPITTRGVTLHNRFMVSPMCTYSARDGHLTDWHIAHLGQFALGGAAAVMVEASAVEPRGRISPEDSGVWADSHVGPLKRVVDVIHSQGQKAAIQIAHAGRKASTMPPWIGGSKVKRLADESQGGWPEDTVAPSAIPYAEGHALPRALSVDEIKGLVKAFADGARRAVAAGFDIIEIHGAHGYLITEFLSPISNKRTDAYGGSFENRTRFLLEVIAAVRAAIPDTTSLWLRISSTEWMEKSNQPSWTVDDTIRLAKLLPDAGIDVLDISSGGNHPDQVIKMHSLFQIDIAGQVRAALRANGQDLLIAAVGRITDAELARSTVQKPGVDGTVEVQGENGQVAKADFALVAKQFLRDPQFVLKTAQELGVDVKWPHQYMMAKPKPKAQPKASL